MYSGVRNRFLVWVLQAFGFGSLTETELSLLSLSAPLYSALLGVISHGILGERAFGRSLNGLIGFVGGCLSLVIYAWCGGRITRERFDMALIVVATASAAFLLICALVKSVLLPKLASFVFDGKGGPARLAPAAEKRAGSIPAGRLRF